MATTTMGTTVYTRADLELGELEQLLLPYREWKKKYGAMGNDMTRMVCQVLGVSDRELGALTVLELIQVEEKLNAQMLVMGRGSYIERWACRWLREGA